jgi:hypothetical protein
MEKYLPKPISCLLVALVMLCACSDNDDCRNRPVYNYPLVQDDYAQLQLVTYPSYKFVHEVNGTVKDTVELFYAGVDAKRTSLEKTRTYSEYSNKCYTENYDNIDTRKYLYIGDQNKVNSLQVVLMAARVNYSSYYWENSYNLDTRKNLDVKWGNRTFSCFVDELQGQRSNYNPTFTFKGRTFNEVYFLKNGTSEIYLNKNIVAHIKVDNETWTKL